MSDPRNESGGPQGSTTPSLVDLDTRQAVYDVDRKVEVLTNEVKHVVKNREEDRKAGRRALSKLEKNFRRDFDGLRDDLSEFAEKQFEPLRKDVMKLRLSWAKVTALAVVASLVVGLVIEYLKKHYLGL